VGGEADKRMAPQREARLKPQFASVYPGLEPGVWYPAASIAEYFLARPADLPSAHTELTDRVLDETHFEFRGGPDEPLRDPHHRASDLQGGS
jgi:hypothetical protein